MLLVRVLSYATILLTINAYLYAWGWIPLVPWWDGGWWMWLCVFAALVCNALGMMLLTRRRR